MTNDLYIDGLKKGVALLKKFTKFEILLKNDSVDIYAHYTLKQLYLFKNFEVISLKRKELKHGRD